MLSMFKKQKHIQQTSWEVFTELLNINVTEDFRNVIKRETLSFFRQAIKSSRIINIGIAEYKVQILLDNPSDMQVLIGWETTRKILEDKEEYEKLVNLGLFIDNYSLVTPNLDTTYELIFRFDIDSYVLTQRIIAVNNDIKHLL